MIVAFGHDRYGPVAVELHGMDGNPFVKGQFVFAVLLKYNALMALSAASLPFPLPANVALGLVMIAANAASRALVISMRPASHADLGVALALGFGPAALIGLPGLVGLAAAIAARIALRSMVAAPELDLMQHAAEVCFYLGALAARAYI